MLAVHQYKVTGREPKEMGKTLIRSSLAVGVPIIDTIVDNVSVNVGSEGIDNSTGMIIFPGLLARGVTVRILYKKLPRFFVPTIPTMVDFSDSDFSSIDFL